MQEDVSVVFLLTVS